MFTNEIKAGKFVLDVGKCSISAYPPLQKIISVLQMPKVFVEPLADVLVILDNRS